MPRGSDPTFIAPPVYGVKYDAPPHLLPPGYVADSQNMTILNGQYQPRPGYAKLVQAGPADRVMGLAYYKDATLNIQVVAGTLTKWYRLSGGAWVDITGTALTGGPDNPIRFVTFPQGGSTLLIGANGKDTMKKWDGAAATYVDLGGSPPTGFDLCVCANRVITAPVIETGVLAPSRVRVSDFNNAESWPGSLVADLTDTDDTIVGVKSINRLAFVIYKDASQWIGVAQVGLFPYAFSQVDAQPGPVSKAAVVAIGNAHYYLGQDGSFYRFDGIQCQEIGQPIQPLILNTIDWNLVGRSFGVYCQRYSQIWWFYPGLDQDAPMLGVLYEIHTGRFEPIKVAHGLTAGSRGVDLLTITIDGLDAYSATIDGLDAAFPTIDSMGGTVMPMEFFGAASGQVYKGCFGTSDDGLPIDASWVLPLMASPAGTNRINRFDAVETFFLQTPDSVVAEVTVGVSNTLGAGPVFGTPQDVDLSVDTLHQLTLPDTEGRWLSIKHRIQTTVGGVAWQGAQLYANNRGVS